MKTILFLMNGFGIETKESYSVYNEELMPNFDKLASKYMFSRINSSVKTLYEGYRNMSLEIGELYNYHIYNREDNNGNISNNETLSTIRNDLTERKSKLHIFVFVDKSIKVVDNIKSFIKNINPNNDKKIYLHLVLTSTNYEDYPEILNVLSRINIEIGEMATIGMVLGLETILNSNPIVELNFFLKILITEVGEKWQSFKQKLDVSYGTKKSPTSIKPFVVNNGFSINSNDLFMIWNYDNIDLTNFINGIKSINYGQDVPNIIKFYSLFPITYSDKIPFMLNYETSSKSLANNMKGLAFKTLVVCKKGDVNVINYYLNGLNKVNNPDISYIAGDNIMYDSNTITNIINTNPQELMIFNYDITSCETIMELNDILKKIDTVIGSIYDIFVNNDINIIISSIYGMEKNIPNEKEEICHVKYDKIPIIYINKNITKKDYIINDGDVNGLLKLCYKTINNNYNGDVMIEKKNLLYRLIFK